MTVWQIIKKGFKNMLITDGRATRQEFWIFALFAAAMIALASRLDGLAQDSMPIMFLMYFIIVACGLPAITCNIRRLHDVGKSGGWVFISIIPVIGWIVDVVFCVRDSQYGENKFGLNPKGIGNPDPNQKKKKKKSRSK